MGIYIPDMEMPKEESVIILIEQSGSVWKINRDEREDELIAEAIEVPNHGRLIDADTLKAYWEPDHNRYFDADHFIHTIECAPTVIPASEGET